MNAVVLAYGLAEGGREGAQDRAHRLLAPHQPRRGHGAAAALAGRPPAAQSRARLLAGLPDARLHEPDPVALSAQPANYNPLRHVLEQSVDFDRLRALAPVKLFLSATNVRTGKVRIFTNPEITSDAVMASACLPFMFQAVEIDGEAYWDGGYMGNPAIYPLIYHCASPDVVVVHINPLERPEIPRTATEIMNRINEISFNSSLMREMRAIAFVTRLVETGAVCDQSLKRMHIHAIAADAVMQKLSVIEQAQRRLGVPHPPARRRARVRRPLAGRALRPRRAAIRPSTCTTAISEPRASPLRRPAPRPIPARCR